MAAGVAGLVVISLCDGDRGQPGADLAGGDAQAESHASRLQVGDVAVRRVAPAATVQIGLAAHAGAAASAIPGLRGGTGLQTACQAATGMSG